MTKCACCERDIGDGDFIFEGLNNDSVCFQCRGYIVCHGTQIKAVIKNDVLIAKWENYIRKYKGVNSEKV